jgi:Zn-dependent M28 family amino/carboxypeptidase
MSKLRAAKPALLIVLERSGLEETGPASAQLLDPQDRDGARAPRITVSGQATAAFYDELKPGFSPTAAASVHLAPPKETQLALHNVVAVLRGSDPVLKNTCVLVSAHYDHIGTKPTGPGDRIYNGANDDGSGTVSVLELAAALAKLNPHPRRTIVFVTFFGEEKGGFGSRYYAAHPAFPIKDTIADINLEQVGRTDSTEGRQTSNASLTGFDYSDVARVMQQAGALTGVKIYKHSENSDLYFGASDNVSLAEKGVPAHTVCVAFNYSDYHGVGDEWQKIDYDNMAKVDRTVALALLMMADNAAVPHWNAANPKAANYLKVWRENHGN